MRDSERRPSSSLDRGAWRPDLFTVGIAVVATLALVFLLEWRRRPAPPADTDAPPETFSAQRALRELKVVLDEDRGTVPPRPVGSRAADRVRRRIQERLIVHGVEPDKIQVQRTVACRDSERWSYVGCAPVENLVARLPGPDRGPAVVLMVHYDSVAAGPGVSDDGAGVAALLETVRALLEEDPGGASRRSPMVVLATDAEEVSLYGARGFVDRHPLATEGDGIGAVLNVEARGTSGQSLLFQTSPDDAWIIDTYASVAPRPATSSLYAEIYRRLPNDTDLSVFLDAGFVGVNFAYAEGVQRYHTPLDDLEHLDRGSLQHHGENLLAMARALASDPRLADPPSGSAVYSDIGSWFVLSYPSEWALPLAVVALLGLLGLAAVTIRRGEAGVVPGAVSSGVLLATLVAAVGAGAGYGRLVTAITGAERPAWAHPLAFRTGLWALVFLVTALGVALQRRAGRRWPALRPGGWDLALAGWLVLALLGLVLAAVAPGVSHFAVIPILAVLLLGLPVAASLASWSRNLAVLAGALSTAFFWLPLARSLEMGMGLHATGLVAAPLAICTVAYAPLFQAASTTGRRGVPILLALLAAGGLVGAVLVEPYDRDHPQPVDVVHFEDRVGEEIAAEILVDPGFDLPPGPVRGAADLSSRPREAPGGLRLGEVFVASTDPVPLPAPRLELLDVEPTAEGRRIRFRLVGPEADRLRLELPEDARPVAAHVAGYDFELAGKEPVRDRHVVSCRGPECDGIELSLELAGKDPVTGELYAVRYGSVHGLPEAARRVSDARPGWAVPAHSGDRTAVRSRVTLPGAPPRTDSDPTPARGVQPAERSSPSPR